MKVESRILEEGFARTQEVTILRDDGEPIAAVRVRLLGQREDGPQSFEVETSVRSEQAPMWGEGDNAPMVWKIGKEHAWLPPDHS
ncbi:MAG: hypothetical protein ACJ79H_17565 [Myxococcales bacterium]